MTVLGRRNLEAYLYDDEVLSALCALAENPGQWDALRIAKAEALRRSVEDRNNPPDDLKPAAPEIYDAAKRLLRTSTKFGNDCCAFERNVLSKLIKPGTLVYDELKGCVFP